jgi:cell division protein FtsW
VARTLKSDRVLFLATCVLVFASIVMVYSASAFVSLDKFGDDYQFVTRQILWVALGSGLAIFAMRVDYRTYRNDAFIAAIVGAVLLMLVVVLFSAPINSTRRWFGVGGLGGQPSEFAKVACVLFTALFLERRMHRIDEPSYSLLPIGLVVGMMVALIYKQPDFGTAASVLLIVGVMIFAAGLNYKYLVGGALALVPILALMMISASYRLERFMAFMNPELDPTGAGYQARQSLIAIGAGGVFGRGLTAGVQKMGFLPEPHTDFIFAVIGEELGLLGATAFVACFCVIAWRGLRIALRAPDAFGGFVALGLTTMICAQALVNMSVALSLVPTKGIPLPLVSSGGSSLVVSLLGIGILLNISQHETADA